MKTFLNNKTVIKALSPDACSEIHLGEVKEGFETLLEQIRSNEFAFVIPYAATNDWNDSYCPMYLLGFSKAPSSVDAHSMLVELIDHLESNYFSRSAWFDKSWSHHFGSSWDSQDNADLIWRLELDMRSRPVLLYEYNTVMDDCSGYLTFLGYVGAVYHLMQFLDDRLLKAILTRVNENEALSTYVYTYEQCVREVL